MRTGTATVLRGDARALPLADDTVDLVVTSPPYFALRSYQDNGEHYAGQIGSEPTPKEFVDALLEVTAECVRVLKSSGSLWVNLGDKYASNGPSGPQGATGQRATRTQAATYAETSQRQRKVQHGIREKSLMGIPWRYALRCIDDLGLILRAEVIWSKPNGLPESVTDRVRRSHEQWFHFTLNPRYFSAVDEIREAHARAWGGTPNGGGYYGSQLAPGAKDANLPAALPNPLGKLPGSVWTVPTEPLKVPDHLGIDHFAAFPTEWPKRIISAWSPAGVCAVCGEGRRPVVTKPSPLAHVPPASVDRVNQRQRGATSTTALSGSTRMKWEAQNPPTLTGYACGCPEPDAPSTPGVVLDPFGGTGTVAMVAKALGRHGITVDMSNDYCRLADWRTGDRNQLAKVLGIEKAPVPDAAQGGLFDLGGDVA